MEVIQTRLPGVLLIEPGVHRDDRGWFRETWRENTYRQAGIPDPFVQDNAARSTRGVLRGLHYQHPAAQGKLVSVLHGAVFDVAVDIRRGSPHFGDWVGFDLSADNGLQLYVPPGFAHGYVVTTDHATFIYKCTEYYDPSGDQAVRWDDPAIGIDWPVQEPILSAKDAGAVLLEDIPPDRLPGMPS